MGGAGERERERADGATNDDTYSTVTVAAVVLIALYSGVVASFTGARMRVRGERSGGEQRV